ncbi:hypothetical protein niasHT_029162 [Heterodera trifolii]|uniref:Uncharacterized protein n=1 Tax=Heterodera trifolii TaxID=157864 RepID=A0ABD2JYK4_9BILA
MDRPKRTPTNAPTPEEQQRMEYRIRKRYNSAGFLGFEGENATLEELILLRSAGPQRSKRLPPEAPPKPLEWRCTKCSHKPFETLRALSTHMRIHSGATHSPVRRPSIRTTIDFSAASPEPEEPPNAPEPPTEVPQERWVDPLPEKLQFQQQENKFAELKCKYSRANAKVRWYKGRKELFSDGPKYEILIDKQSITLIINNPDPDDSGKYKCEANGVPTNSFVTVEGPSIKYVFLTPLPNTMEIYRTKQGVLTCKLNSARAPLVWQRDDEKPIDVDDTRYQIEKDAAGCFTLTIRVVEQIDQGMWTATVNKDVISKCQVYVVEDPRDTFVMPVQLRNEKAAIEALRRANAEHELRPNDAEHETESSDVNEDEYVVESDDDIPAVEVRCAYERLLAKAPLNVPGPPGPPKPLHTAYNSITLQWTRPLRDGGTPITGYELEKRERGTNAQWEKAAFGSVPDTRIKVTGVKQYHFYEFRVAAVNAVGQGEWSDNSVPIAATRSSCKPLITMGMLARENDLGSDSVDLRLEVVDRPAPPEGSETAGACPTIVINKEVSVQGPSVVPLKSQRANEKEKDAAQIQIPKTAQPSSAHGIGPSLALTPLDAMQCCSNDLTPPRPKNTVRCADERLLAKAPLNVPVRPGPPKLLYTTDNAIMLQWAQPLRDRGTPITDYELEKCECGTKLWEKAATTNAALWEKEAFGNVPDTRIKVTGVKPQHMYEFRVAAVNAAGRGEWSDNSVPIAATPSSCKPLITMGPFACDMTVLVGEQAKLLVPYASNKRTKFLWSKDGNPVLSRS